jgi:hypothetical protein
MVIASHRVPTGNTAGLPMDDNINFYSGMKLKGHKSNPFAMATYDPTITKIRETITTRVPGNIFIDRDPSLFSLVLQSLREGHNTTVLRAMDVTIMRMLNRELRYYGLPEVEKLKFTLVWTFQ